MHKLTAKQARRLALWRVIELRLEEARTLTDMMDTKDARAQMRAIARGYDRLISALAREQAAK
jgi:hypothetical protein